MNHDNDVTAFNQRLCEFINASPTPFHATAQLALRLESAGFTELDETASWQLAAGERYFVRRNQSSLIAWIQGEQSAANAGFRMVGAHTDSPCLRVKPAPDLHDAGVWRLGVEVYGGALLNPWFDRDLSIAGRVHYQQSSGNIAARLIDLRRPVATIPSLAIHLDREANSKRSVNAQTQLPVVLGLESADSGSEEGTARFAGLLLEHIQQRDPDASEVLDFELCLYDTQPASLLGIDAEFIATARLDNLLSCFVGCDALCDLPAGSSWSMLICSDHEEVGSASAAGAAGPFLKQVLSRLLPDPEAFARAMQQSVLLSTDNAHALHPSHRDRMDPQHSPLINGGPVIKVNANQRYASNSQTQALFRRLCKLVEVPVQSFVTRSDMGCGSTIGPITAAEIGVQTLDVGVPTWGMHSIRELAGSRDARYLKQVLEPFYRRD